MFEIKNSHRELWLLKKAPKFIQDSMIPKRVTSFTRVFDIDSCIPKVEYVRGPKGSRSARSYQFPTKTTECELHNTIWILQSKRKRGQDIVSSLVELIQSNDPTPKNVRKAFCARWLRRIIHNRMKPIYEQMPELKKFVDTGKIGFFA